MKVTLPVEASTSPYLTALIVCKLASYIMTHTRGVGYQRGYKGIYTPMTVMHCTCIRNCHIQQKTKTIFRDKFQTG